MTHEHISDVVVMHSNPPMRLLLRLLLTADGYTVTEVSTYRAVLRHLYAAASPTAVVVGNLTYDYAAERAFFAHVAADAVLARRHRFVLLSTLPDWQPVALDASLRSLGVPVLRLPCGMLDLLTAVATVAGRKPAEDRHQRGKGASVWAQGARPLTQRAREMPARRVALLTVDELHTLATRLQAAHLRSSELRARAHDQQARLAVLSARMDAALARAVAERAHSPHYLRSVGFAETPPSHRTFQADLPT